MPVYIDLIDAVQALFVMLIIFSFALVIDVQIQRVEPPEDLIQQLLQLFR